MVVAMVTVMVGAIVAVAVVTVTVGAIVVVVVVTEAVVVVPAVVLAAAVVGVVAVGSAGRACGRGGDTVRVTLVVGGDTSASVMAQVPTVGEGWPSDGDGERRFSDNDCWVGPWKSGQSVAWAP